MWTAACRSDNYHEQSYRCYPNDQKGPCSRVALEPMCVHAHEGRPPLNNELNAALKNKINKLLICCCSPATLTCYLFPNTLRSPFGQSLPGFGPKCAWSGGCHGLCTSRTVAVLLPSCIRHGHRPRSSDLNQLRKLLPFMPTLSANSSARLFRSLRACNLSHPRPYRRSSGAVCI